MRGRIAPPRDEFLVYTAMFNYGYATMSYLFQIDHRWYLTVLVCFVALGCSGEGRGAKRAAARGTVTVDGEPVESGMIQFTPSEGNTGPVAGAVIENGKYSVGRKQGPVVGTNLVEISGTRMTGKKIKSRIGFGSVVR